MQMKLTQKIVIARKFALYSHDNNTYTRNFSQRQIQKHHTENQHYISPPLPFPSPLPLRTETDFIDARDAAPPDSATVNYDFSQTT